ncbi:hypothetical protein M8J76_015439 [Diaphorina citri]|nr:hypothetical protein M8J76_015439 [Diaphorina citri]
MRTESAYYSQVYSSVELPKAVKVKTLESMANSVEVSADDAKGKVDELKDLPKEPKNVADEDSSDGGRHSSGSSDFSFTRKTRSHAKKSDASGPNRAPKSTASSKGTTQRGGTRSEKAVMPKKDSPAGKESDRRVLRDLEESIEGALEEADELQKTVGRLDRISKADKEKVGKIVKNLKGHANRAKHALDEITVGKIQGMISTEVQMAVEKAMRLERARVVVVPGKSYSQSLTSSPVSVKNGNTMTAKPAALSAAVAKPDETKDSRTKPSSGHSPKGAPAKVPRAREVHVPSIGKVPIRPRKEAGFMKEMTKVSHLPTKMYSSGEVQSSATTAGLGSTGSGDDMLSSATPAGQGSTRSSDSTRSMRKPLVLISGYFKFNKPIEPMIERLSEIMRVLGGFEVISGGDINARSELWHDARTRDCPKCDD